MTLDLLDNSTNIDLFSNELRSLEWDDFNNYKVINNPVEYSINAWDYKDPLNPKTIFTSGKILNNPTFGVSANANQPQETAFISGNLGIIKTTNVESTVDDGSIAFSVNLQQHSNNLGNFGAVIENNTIACGTHGRDVPHLITLHFVNPTASMSFQGIEFNDSIDKNSVFNESSLSIEITLDNIMTLSAIEFSTQS